MKVSEYTEEMKVKLAEKLLNMCGHCSLFEAIDTFERQYVEEQKPRFSKRQIIEAKAATNPAFTLPKGFMVINTTKLGF